MVTHVSIKTYRVSNRLFNIFLSFPFCMPTQLRTNYFEKPSLRMIITRTPEPSCVSSKSLKNIHYSLQFTLRYTAEYARCETCIANNRMIGLCQS